MTPQNHEPTPGDDDLPGENASPSEPSAAGADASNDPPVVPPPHVADPLGSPYASPHAGPGAAGVPPTWQGQGGSDAQWGSGAYPGSGGASPYGPPAPGGYPYGSQGQFYPGMMPPPVEDNRPGLWWGILGGVLVILLCVLFVSMNSGWGLRIDAWFIGVTISFAIVPVVATILVIPFTTRKIGQGMFIVLGAIPLIWFGVCVQALTSY